MNTNFKFSLFFITVLLSILFFTSCKKNDPEPTLTLPTLISIEPSEITGSSVISGGEITDAGNTEIIQKGICWSTYPTPTISDYITIEEGSTKSFSSNITGLMPNTIYYVRAYATNKAGAAYGNTFVLKTAKLPEIYTQTPYYVTYYSAELSGLNIIDNGHFITEKGICWSSSNINPTINDNKLTGGTGAENFRLILRDLNRKTTYYYKAYAINQNGIGYGNTMAFTTSEY